MDSQVQSDLIPNRAQAIMDEIERLTEELAALDPNAALRLEAWMATFRARAAVIRFSA